MAEYTVGIDALTLDATIALTSYTSQDTVWVPPGTYNITTALDCEHSSGWTYPVLLRGTDPSNRPIINGSGIASGRGVNCGLGYAGGSTGTLTFKDLIFEQFNGLTQGVFYNPFAIIRLENVKVMNCSSPVVRWLTGSASRQAWVKQCEFLSTGIAIRTSGTSAYITIENCEGYMNSNTEFLIGSLGEIYNCSISINSTSGSVIAVACETATNVSVTNRGTTAHTGIAATGTYKNCHTYGTFANQFTGTNGGSNISGSDPLWANPATGDFTPGSLSPLINAGFTIGSVATDIIGTARPQGAGYDIGSVEKILATTYSGITVISNTVIRLSLTASVTYDATATDPANYIITETTGFPVSVIGAAPNANPMSYIDITTDEHTNGTIYNLAWAGITNLTNDNDDYTGTGTAPTINTITMTDRRKVRVTFSESMNNDAALTNTAHYVFNPSVTVLSVTRINATQVDVIFSEEIKNANPQLAVNGPKDLAGNEVSDSDSFVNAYIWVASIARMSDTVVRVTFGNGTVNPANASLLNIANYQVSRVAPETGVIITPSSVSPDAGGTYVDITMDKEQTTGQVYRLTMTNVDNVQ